MRKRGVRFAALHLSRAYVAFMLGLCLSGCVQDKAQQELVKWRVTLDKEDKRPYGAYLAYQSLKYYFPDAKIVPLSRSFRYSNMGSKMNSNYYGRSVLILEGLDFYVNEQEWTDLKNFISSGNEVVLFCSQLDSKIEDELNCHKQGQGGEDLSYFQFTPGHDNENVLTISGDRQSPFFTERRYGYEGHSLKGYFTFQPDSAKTAEDNVAHKFGTATADSSTPYPDTLGHENDQPDIVRYKLGDGHLTIHAAPLVLSNYFLLQNGNEDYLTALWATLPGNINRIYWNDYYKRNTEAAGLDVLMRFPATKWALIIGVLALLLYILFEGKRKQRIIPVIAPLKNDSVSFVETVGRLYYNKGNHTNLAEKMTQQFLEWVRMHYFLNTNLINEQFIHQLTIKSGQREATVRGLVEMIHEIKTGSAKPDDAYLYQLYNTIQQFYKNQHE